MMLAGTKAFPLAVLLAGADGLTVCLATSAHLGFRSSIARTINMLFLSAGRVVLSKALMIENKLESERNNL